MTPIHLPRQHASLHDLPDDQASLSKVLAEAVSASLAHQRSDGDFADPAITNDVGDLSLGVVSLLCLAWHRGDRRDDELVDAVRRGVDHFLRQRVFRKDNPGQLLLLRRDSGLPYARYLLGDGALPFGDWPSTVWAMLHAVNVLELGESLLTDTQYDDVTELAIGYWHWLTEASVFNWQGTGNQAIASIAGALMLARHLRSHGRADEGERIAADASRRYDEHIRASRVIERGYALPPEHGAGHDQNYLPISLTFLAQAYRVSGDERFLEDGDEIARYIDTRLSVRGFDFGGPRYSEQHCGAEAMLGMRFFSRRVGADLGRYLGDRGVSYYPLATTGAPSGHFAFATVWLLQDDSTWFRAGDEPCQTTYSVRCGLTSVTLTDTLTPYVIDAAGSAVIEAIVDQQHGIGPVLRYPDGVSMLLTRPIGRSRVREARSGSVAAKLVTKPVVTRHRVMIGVQQLIVCDGRFAHLITVLDRALLPADAVVEFLAGLPYVEDVGGAQRKIVELRAAGERFGLGVAGAELRTDGAVRAEKLTIRSAGSLRVVNPPEGIEYFNSRNTIGLTVEQLGFALADDPKGFGNPDSGWRRVRASNQVLAGPIDVAPRDRAVFAVRYGPEPDAAGGASGDVYTATAKTTPEGVLVRTAGFEALIGHPAGDENGEPALVLTASPAP